VLVLVNEHYELHHLHSEVLGQLRPDRSGRVFSAGCKEIARFIQSCGIARNEVNCDDFRRDARLSSVFSDFGPKKARSHFYRKAPERVSSAFSVLFRKLCGHNSRESCASWCFSA
jgi:hypothetical protein